MDRRKISKSRKLEDCIQCLEQAKLSGDRVRIKMWQDIIKKIESQNANDKHPSKPSKS